MTEAPIISVRNLSKAYSIYERPRDILLETILGDTRHDTFWALKDVSFNVHEGERVGSRAPRESRAKSSGERRPYRSR